MSRWHQIVAGTVAVAAAAIAGCGSTGQSPAGSNGAPQASRPAVTSLRPTGGPGSTGTGGTTEAYLRSSEPVPFTGEVVELTVQALAGTAAPQQERLASATVSFGDGAAATVREQCTRASQTSLSPTLVFRHAYQQTGTVTPQVTAATVCGQSGQPVLGTGPSLRVLPAAPVASASWPQCGQSQIGIAATGNGAGLGHVGVLFTLRNTSSASCRLDGYPGMQLLGSNGQPLPTTVVRAGTGAYLFPAVAPHRVAMPPGATASFDLQYGDSPVGAQANEPYARACPQATSAEVTLPNVSDHSVVPVSMAPCGGRLLVSPVVPGSQWLSQ